MEFNVIFVAGPQGSGKGTQGKKLAERLGFLYWGMGHVLREISKEDTPLAKKIDGIMNEGTLLSDEVIVEVMKDRLSVAPHERGIIFDGVPRTVGQAEFLVPFLRQEGWKNMATLFIDLPREESIKRLLSRAEHESRTDDTPEAIEKRFQDYDETMSPTVEYLKKETKFISIDGRPTVDEIAKNVEEALATS